mmetsp:Transcript_3534/g.9027  ORF Transcript_3534/g.9027 Transcript_3534/m.9027 type:complete len:152 (+) Transcript_3534:3095-3550(+)
MHQLLLRLLRPQLLQQVVVIPVAHGISKTAVLILGATPLNQIAWVVVVHPSGLMLVSALPVASQRDTIVPIIQIAAQDCTARSTVSGITLVRFHLPERVKPGRVDAILGKASDSNDTTIKRAGALFCEDMLARANSRKTCRLLCEHLLENI